MPKKNEIPTKEVYRLWWNYWRRCKTYKEFRIWAKQSELIPRQIRLWGTHISENDIIFSFLFPLAEDTILHELPIPITSNQSLFLWLSLYDGPEDPFEIWWSLHGSLFSDRSNDAPWTSVDDYSNWFDDEFNYIVNLLRNRMGRKPSLEKFRELFNTRLKDHRFGRSVISVNIRPNESTESICRKFKKLISKKRRDHQVDDSFYYFYPTKPIRFEDIKKYLDVYDHRIQGLKWREIAKVVHSRREWNESLERALHIDFNNAEKIIQNVEKGLFPGKY